MGDARSLTFQRTDAMPRFILPVSDFGKHLLNAARDSNYCLTFLLSGQSVEKSAKIKWRNKQFLSSAPCSPLTAAVVLPHPLVGGPPQPDPPRHTLQKLPKGSPLFSLLPPCNPPLPPLLTLVATECGFENKKNK